MKWVNHFQVVAYSHLHYAKLTVANDATTVAGRRRRLLLLGFDDIADILWVIFVVKFTLIDLSGSLIDYSTLSQSAATFSKVKKSSE